LFFASPRGRWHPFAILTLRRAAGRSDDLRFDAGRRMLPGARMDEWIRAVRQPSYDRVQRGGLGGRAGAKARDVREGS
jgi:hypothetical protein